MFGCKCGYDPGAHTVSVSTVMRRWTQKVEVGLECRGNRTEGGGTEHSHRGLKTIRALHTWGKCHDESPYFIQLINDSESDRFNNHKTALQNISIYLSFIYTLVKTFWFSKQNFRSELSHPYVLTPA